jgi:hypothetical protein
MLVIQSLALPNYRTGERARPVAFDACEMLASGGPRLAGQSEVRTEDSAFVGPRDFQMDKNDSAAPQILWCVSPMCTIATDLAAKRATAGERMVDPPTGRNRTHSGRSSNASRLPGSPSISANSEAHRRTHTRRVKLC